MKSSTNIKKGCTCAVMYITPQQQILLVHPTGGRHDGWSLPKGLCEVDESPAEAAARELFEETGIVIDHTLLVDLGRSSYTTEKDYHLFAYYSPNDIDTKSLICESYFTTKHGVTIKEVDNYTLAAFDVAIKMINVKQAIIIANSRL